MYFIVSNFKLNVNTYINQMGSIKYGAYLACTGPPTSLVTPLDINVYIILLFFPSIQECHKKKSYLIR